MTILNFGGVIMPSTYIFQGDLGHTDLQEDLEFHSSSKLLDVLFFVRIHTDWIRL